MGNGEMLIGELSRRSGYPSETIRYYERIGLLPAPARVRKYRHYGATDLERLAFVRCARALGFTLNEVRLLLKLSRPGTQGACRQALDLATTHLGRVRARIADLVAVERLLTDAVRQCDGEDATECTVLGTLASSSCCQPAPGFGRTLDS